MAKTKFFRVAVAGATVDGRVIEPEMIQQMADTYNPATYTARINCEHLRGYSPDAPFNAYGSVAELKAGKIDIEIGGKTEKRLALFASFEVNDQAKSINKNGQKLFTSVEINPNFADSKKAYLVGIALTDSPASLGTEVLKFSKDEKKKDHLIALSDGFELEFEDEGSAAASEVTGAFAAMKKFFTDLSTPKSETEPKPEPKPEPAQQPDMSAFSTAMVEGLDKLAQAFTSASNATEARIAKLSEEFTQLKADLEKTPTHKHTARPPATGGGDAIKAEF